MTLSRVRVWLGVFIVVVFLAGVGTGMLVDRYAPIGALPRTRPMFSGRMFAPAERPPDVLMRRLADHLQLTPEQRTKIQAIFASRSTELHHLQADLRARFEDEQRTLHQQIEQVLTPEQQKRFRELVDRPPAGRPGGGPRWPGGGPGQGRGRRIW